MTVERKLKERGKAGEKETEERCERIFFGKMGDTWGDQVFGWWERTSIDYIGSFFADGEVVPGMGSEAAVEEFGDEKVSYQRTAEMRVFESELIYKRVKLMGTYPRGAPLLPMKARLMVIKEGARHCDYLQRSSCSNSRRMKQKFDGFNRNLKLAMCYVDRKSIVNARKTDDSLERRNFLRKGPQWLAPSN